MLSHTHTHEGGRGSLVPSPIWRKGNLHDSSWHNPSSLLFSTRFRRSNTPVSLRRVGTSKSFFHSLFVHCLNRSIASVLSVVSVLSVPINHDVHNMERIPTTSSVGTPTCFAGPHGGCTAEVHGVGGIIFSTVQATTAKVVSERQWYLSPVVVSSINPVPTRRFLASSGVNERSIG